MTTDPNQREQWGSSLGFILAASGYIKPNPVEQAFRNARLGPIVGHTSEVARMAIADDVLKTLVR